MSSEGTELSGGQPIRLEDRARALALDEALQHLHAALLVEDGNKLLGKLVCRRLRSCSGVS